MVYIYALELENVKYYIGKTDNPEYRIENHFNSTGSAWKGFGIVTCRPSNTP